MSSSAPPLVHDPDSPALVLAHHPTDDPPPPYPTPTRRSRHHRRRRLPAPDSPHSHPTLDDDDHDPAYPSPNCDESLPDHLQPTESTPLLNPNDSTSPQPLLYAAPIRRRRTLSLTSTLRSSASIAPSFAHTVFSAFHPERDSDLDPEDHPLDSDILPHSRHNSDAPDPDSLAAVHNYSARHRPFAPHLSHRAPTLPFAARCRRYFRPLRKRAYYASLLHLTLINFPYALLCWLFIFVFTLVGTCTLMALPLGAVICFLDLLGARVLARGELFLQTKFHSPIAYPLPVRPIPIFTRTRTPTPAQVEAGTSSDEVVQETSFYRNAYAMFTDATSYQALFYFLVLKPGVTVLMFLFFLIATPVATVLVIPLPAVLRLARRMGVWQANVAVEGLYFGAQ